MKAQCGKHLCSELLCGCPSFSLEEKPLLNKKEKAKLSAIKNRAIRFEAVNKEDSPMVIWFIERYLSEQG